MKHPRHQITNQSHHLPPRHLPIKRPAAGPRARVAASTPRARDQRRGPPRRGSVRRRERQGGRREQRPAADAGGWLEGGRRRDAAAGVSVHPARAESVRTRARGVGVRSISHWSPYDRVGVVNADPQGLFPALQLPDYVESFQLDGGRAVVDAIAAHELLGRGLAEDTAEEDFAAAKMEEEK
eukprot:29915-Pelagococcus_subviridis.AAC.1